MKLSKLTDMLFQDAIVTPSVRDALPLGLALPLKAATMPVRSRVSYCAVAFGDCS